MKKIKILQLLLIIVFIITLSCQKSREFIRERKRGGMLIVSIMEEPSTLNPLYPSLSGLSPITEQLFAPLISEKPNGKVRPGLAKSWIYSEDLKSITYTIRKDAKWHDGKSVTAEDVVFTVNQIKNPKINSPLSQRLRYIKDVEAIGEKKVRFTLEKVYADELLHTNIRPIPKHKIGKNLENLKKSDLGLKPVGSGPYKLKEWKHGEWLELAANPDYFMSRPNLDRIVFYFPSSKEELIDELNLGNIDFAYDMPPAKYDKFKVYKTVLSPGKSYTYIGWNLKRFKDKKLREAFSMAIDRKGIISDNLKGYGRIVNGPITPEHWAYSPGIKGIQYNREKAGKLIRELGYSKKRFQKFYSGLNVRILVESGDEIRKKVAEHIASDLRLLGVEARLTELQSSEFITRLFNHNFDAYILGWNVEKVFNPLPIWGSDGIYNFVGYKNKNVDELMREALLSLDREKARNAWLKFQEIIANDFPYTFLYEPQKITLVKKNLQGISPNDKRPILSFLDELWYIKRPATIVEFASLGHHYRESQEEIETISSQVTATTEEILQASAPTNVPGEGVIGAGEEEEGKSEKEEKPAKKEPIIPPKITYYPTEIEYPETAKKLEITGQVFVKIYINKEGNVYKAEISRGLFPPCDSVALKAAFECKFDPATQAGKPVEYSQTIPFRFPPGGW